MTASEIAERVRDDRLLSGELMMVGDPAGAQRRRPRAVLRQTRWWLKGRRD